MKSMRQVLYKKTTVENSEVGAKQAKALVLYDAVTMIIGGMLGAITFTYESK